MHSQVRSRKHGVNMNDEWLYIRIGGALGIIPAFITFVGAWWYCAATYGFLFGFGLGWLPALILAALVELAFMVLWGPALGAIALFVIIPAISKDTLPPQAPTTAAPSPDPKDYSKMSDDELLREVASQCGKLTSLQMSKEELQEVIVDCFE